MGRFEEILKSIAPGGATRHKVPARPPKRVKKTQGPAPKPEEPAYGTNSDALEKLIAGAARSRRTDDVMDSVTARADDEANKPAKGKGSRTPIRREMPIEEIRSMIATPEGLAEVKRHIGDDPGNRKQKAIRAAMYARNKSWADEFDLALAGDTPAKPLDSGFEGVGAGEGARAAAEEGDGQYVSRPDDPKAKAAEKKNRGKKKYVAGYDKQVNTSEAADVTLLRKRLPEERAQEDRLYKDAEGTIRAGGKRLSANLKNVYDALKKEYNKFKRAGLATNADGTPYTFAQFKEDNAPAVTGTKVVDDAKVREKKGKGRLGYPSQNESNNTQQARQRSRAVSAAGVDPSRPEGSMAGADPSDVVQPSDMGTLSQRSTQPPNDRADSARQLMRDTFEFDENFGHGDEQVLGYLRKADDDSALHLAYNVARDALIDKLPIAERATDVANHDAIHGVVQGLFAAADRRMPTTMPEWYNDLETKAQAKTEKLFPSRGQRTGAQPSRTLPESGPLPLPNKRFDPTIAANPELDPKPTLPVDQRATDPAPTNIEEQLTAYHAGKVTDPDQRAYLEDIIKTRRIAADNTLDENGNPIKGMSGKTPVKRKPKSDILTEASDVTVADAATTPGEELIVAKGKGGKVVEAITGAGAKPGKKTKGGAAVSEDLAGKAADIDSGGAITKGKADGKPAQGGGFSRPLAERYSALAEDARNADGSRAQEMQDRLAALDAELAATPEAKRASAFEAAGSAEEAVTGLGPAPAATTVVEKPAAKGKGKAAAPAAPAVSKKGKKDPAAPNLDDYGRRIFDQMVTEEWAKARGARKGTKPQIGGKRPVEAEAPKPKPEGTQVGVSDDATGVDGDGNVDVTANKRRVRTKPQPDTSEMEASRMQDEGGMMPVGPNPMTPGREWLEKQARLDEEVYQNDLARRQRAVVDQKNRAAEAERARQQAQRDQWSQTEADVNEVGRRRDANRRSLAENDDMMGQLAQDGIARRRATDARLTEENGAMLDEMAGQASLQSRVRRGRDAMLTQQNGEMMASMARRANDDRLTRENGDFLFAAAKQASERNADRARTRNATAIAAAGAIGGGIYAQTEAERTAPSEPPAQVPDTHTEKDIGVGLPDDEVLDLGNPEDVSAPITRRLPPGFDPLRRPSELTLTNPNRDDLQLPDPHASESMSLPDPNAGREMLASRATNPDDPRAKLARLMKALNR